MVSMRVLLSSIQWGMFQSSQMENYMTSTERLFEYDSLEQEASLEGKGGSRDFNKKWPMKGNVAFQGVSLSYDRGSNSEERNLVLKEVDFHVNSGERVSKLKHNIVFTFYLWTYDL